MLMRVLAATASLGVAVSLLGASPALSDEALSDEAPTVAPIPGTTIGTGALQDLGALGYTESEYVITVTEPKVYRYLRSTTRVRSREAPPSPQGDYRSRFIVRAPADPADFNGRVLVEMMNTTAQVDLDIAWQQAHQYLTRSGWAYVGITVQQTGIQALNRFSRDRGRYSSLGLNLQVPAAAADLSSGRRDPSIAWDLVTQVGRLLTSTSEENPLADFDVESVLLTGQSQMAGYAVTYVNAIHPLENVYDGFLIAYRGSGATNLKYVRRDPTASTSDSRTQRRVNKRTDPVIVLQSGSDPLRGPEPGQKADFDATIWRPDATTPRDRYRLWEVTGSSHNDRWGSEQALGVLRRDYGLPFAPRCDWTSPAGVNDFPARMAWHAALDALAQWAEDDRPAPTAPRVERDDDGAPLLDANGNARGGLRLPRIDVPVAQYRPTSPGALFCPLTGTQTPFDDGDLRSRYPTVDDYVDQVRRAADRSITAGFLLGEDAELLVESARRGPQAEAETIREY